MGKERKEKSGQTKRRKRAAMGRWSLCDRGRPIGRGPGFG